MPPLDCSCSSKEFSAWAPPPSPSAKQRDNCTDVTAPLLPSSSESHQHTPNHGKRPSDLPHTMLLLPAVIALSTFARKLNKLNKWTEEQSNPHRLQNNKCQVRNPRYNFQSIQQICHLKCVHRFLFTKLCSSKSDCQHQSSNTTVLVNNWKNKSDFKKPAQVNFESNV